MSDNKHVIIKLPVLAATLAALALSASACTITSNPAPEDDDDSAVTGDDDDSAAK